MNNLKRLACYALLGTCLSHVANAKDADDNTKNQTIERSITAGTVTIGAVNIPYDAVAGTLVVHPKSWDDSGDVVRERTGEKPNDDTRKEESDNPDAKASMFYVAYFKKGVSAEQRPITFIYNGGPGTSSVWLHMGAFGPKRIVTNDDTHTPAAPYALINNAQSLLDVSDIVFVDAPGTGFGRITGKDREKLFWGVDQDAHAFSAFITQFLARYGRYNSPKYLFGESYGTMRSAVLVNDLQNEESIDFNGVILLSQILNYDNSADEPEANPGMDDPYILALPTYAATAWYHHKLPTDHPDLPTFLHEVEHFATSDYRLALQEGAALDPARAKQIAEKLNAYTGLPVDYILRANLRIDGGEFEKNLQGSTDTTTGRLDTRFSGPTLDPLSKESGYDPQSSAISSAYVSAFNDYTRKVLKFGEQQTYKPEIEIDDWDGKHHLPSGSVAQGAPNVMPDLAFAMKTNPTLKVMLNAGYFDLATPYFEGIYEMQHLPMQRSLQSNIEYKQYMSGHMVYANEKALQQLHDNVADFIKRTDGLDKNATSATPSH